MFNYETCSIDDLIIHINTNSRQVFSSAMKRYQQSGKIEVVEKMRVAKLKAKIFLLEKEIG